MLKFKHLIYLYLSKININIYSNFTNNPKFNNIFFNDYKYTFKFKRNFNRNNIFDIGDKNKIIVKIDHKFNENIIFGLSLSKKQGEKFIFDNKTKRYYFNHYSYFLNIKNLYFHNILINNIVLGNFKVGYGQGLVFNYIDNFIRKPINSTKIFKKQYGLINSKSLKDNIFKGIGINFNIKNVDIAIFGSFKRINAFIYNNKVLSAKIIKNEKYNTLNNLKKKDKLKQYSFGYGINYIYNTFSIGSCFVFTKFNKYFDLLNNDDFNNNFKQLDNLFKSNRHYNFSFFSNIKHNICKFYIEYAHSLNPYKDNNNYGFGLLTCFKISFFKFFKYYFLLRDYSKKYHNFYGNSYGIKKGTVYNKLKGTTNNEIGFNNVFKFIFNNNNILKLCSDIVLLPYQTFYFSKGFNKYFIIDFSHKISFFESLNIQCKFNIEKYYIYSKIKEFYKVNNNICRSKIYLKKNITKKFLTKNNIFLTLNFTKHITKKDIGFAIYEKLCYKNKCLNIVFLLLYSYCSKNTKIYINRYEFDDKTFKFMEINNHLIQTGTNLSIKFYNKIILKGYYIFQYDIRKIRKTQFKNIIYMSINFFS